MLDYDALVGLIYNTSLLLGLAVLYDNLPPRPQARRLPRQILTGLLLGIIGTAVMLTPWRFAPGIVFDTRSILLSLTGLFFGTIPSAIAVLLTSALRIYQGGAGAMTGVAVIMTSAGLGIAWRHYRKWWQIRSSWVELYIFGVVVHIAMLLWMLTLPGQVGVDVLDSISLPVLAIFPVGTVLLGQLLVRQFDRREGEKAVQQNEERLRQIVENMPVMLDAFDENNNIIVWNAECERVTGYKAEKMIGNPHAFEMLYPDETQREEMLSELGERPFHFRNLEWPITTKDGRKKIISWSNISEQHPIPGWFTWAVGVDVTEQKQAEEELRQRESHFRLFFEQSTDGVFIADAEGNYIDVNTSGCQMTGYQRDELILMNIADIIAPEEIERLPTEVARLQMGNNIRSEWRFRRKDGTIFIGEVTGKLLSDGRLQAFLRDITEQKQAELARNEIEARFQRALENIPDVIVIYDKDLRIQFINEATRQVTGRPTSDFIGKTEEELWPPEVYETYLPTLKKAFTTGEIHSVDVDLALTNGETSHLHVTFVPVHDKNGRIREVVGITQNLTELIQMQTALREREHFLSAIVDTSPALIYVFDMTTQSNVYASSSMEELLGYSAAEAQALGADLFAQLIHPDDMAAVVAFQEDIAAAADEAVLEIEYRMRHADGSWRTLHSYERPFLRNEDGSLKQKIGIAIDVTESKQAEEALRQSEVLFSNIFHVGPAALTITRIADGKFINVNDSFLELFGYGREEVISHTSTELNMWTPEERQKLIQKQLKSGGLRNAELTAMSKTGRPIPLLFSSQPMEIAGEACHITTLIDISERVRAEQELRRSEERFSKIFHNSPFPINLFRMADGRSVDVNDAYLSLTGHSREEFINRTAAELNIFIDPNDRVVWINEIEELGKTRQREIQIRQKSGGVRDVVGTIEPIEVGGETFGLAMAIDITERKQAEQERDEARQLFQKIFDLNPVATSLTSLSERKIVNVNEALEKLLGHTRAELIGKTSTTIDYWLNAEERQHAFEILKEQGSIKDYEFSFKTKTGKMGRAVTSAEIFEEYGENYILTTLFDITTRVQAESDLRESEEKFRTAFEHSASGMCLTQPDGSLLRVNQPLCNILGYTKEELEGQHFNDITHPDHIKIGNDVVQQMIAGEVDKVSFEKQYLHKTGAPVWVHINSAPLKNSSGDLQYFITQIENISERKQAEQQLQGFIQRLAILRNIDREIVRAQSPEKIVAETISHIRTLIPCWRASVTLLENGAAKGVVFSVSSESPKVVGKGSHVSLAGNPQFERLKTGKTLLIPDTQELKQPASSAGETLIKAGVRSSVTAPLMANEQLIGLISLTDKQPHFFTIEYQEILEEVANQLAIALNQHQLREAIQRHNEELEERVQQRTAELEAANKELETFTYSVSHDLKAPLRGIDGYSQLLLENYADKLDENGRTFLHKVRHATEQMNQLIEDLLAYSRLERRSIHPKEVDIQSLVNSLINKYMIDIDKQTTAIEVNIPYQTITTDQDGLAMALRNLIENAFKFSMKMPDPHIIIGGQEIEKSYMLWVKDNGIGFEMTYHDRIFEIFQRLHRAEIYPGTGVGLALVRKAMDRLGGKVWAESEPGQGAIFYLELPKS